MKFWERTYLEYFYRQFPCIFKNDKHIVLTFDDGPTPGITEKIVNRLYQRGITGYFLLLGQNVDQYPELMELYKEYGHEAGLHGYHHKPLNTDSAMEDNQIRALNKIRTSDLHIRYARPVYGLLNSRYLEFLKQNNLKLLMWNHTTYDYCHNNPRSWAEKISAQLKEGDILLMHDSEKTDNIYPDGIEYLLDFIEKKKMKAGKLSV